MPFDPKIFEESAATLDALHHWYVTDEYHGCPPIDMDIDDMSNPRLAVEVAYTAWLGYKRITELMHGNRRHSPGTCTCTREPGLKLFRALAANKHAGRFMGYFLKKHATDSEVEKAGKMDPFIVQCMLHHIHCDVREYAHGK